jgi:hypothetical protein
MEDAHGIEWNVIDWTVIETDRSEISNELIPYYARSQKRLEAL